MAHQPRWVLTVALAALLGLTACSGDGQVTQSYTKPTLPPPVSGDADAVEAAVAAAETSDDNPSEPVDVPATGVVFELLAIDNAFAPEVAEVDAGTEVNWTNRGRNPHNIVTEVRGSQDWEVEEPEFQPGDSTSFVFTRPGTYRYFCSIHGTIDVGMPGVLLVQ